MIVYILHYFDILLSIYKVNILFNLWQSLLDSKIKGFKKHGFGGIIFWIKSLLVDLTGFVFAAVYKYCKFSRLRYKTDLIQYQATVPLWVQTEIKSVWLIPVREIHAIHKLLRLRCEEVNKLNGREQIQVRISPC